jgi:hypothetical protein
MTGANCVGTPPGRGLPCPPLVQDQDITGCSALDQGGSWLAPGPWIRIPDARKRRSRRPARVRHSGRAGETRTAGCSSVASPTSDRRYAGPAGCRVHGADRSVRSTAVRGGLAAPTSHTSGAVRCTPADGATVAADRYRVEGNLPGSSVGLALIVPVWPKDLEPAMRAARRPIHFGGLPDGLKMLLDRVDAGYNSLHGLGSLLSRLS